jgi:hypothetical protein
MGCIVGLHDRVRSGCNERSMRWSLSMRRCMIGSVPHRHTNKRLMATICVARTSHRNGRLCAASNEFVEETICERARIAMLCAVSSSVMAVPRREFMACLARRIGCDVRRFDHPFKRTSIEASKRASRGVANRCDTAEKIFDFFCLNYQFGGPDRCCRAWKLLIARDKNSSALIGEPRV